jgi:hypothetical protein
MKRRFRITLKRMVMMGFFGWTTLQVRVSAEKKEMELLLGFP